MATSARPPLKVGLVGYGYAGKTFHAPLIAAVPALALTAVSSSSAAKVQADWPDVAVHDTPAELMRRTDLDLVVIASPNDTHHPLARAALQAGLHVVVDKPFTVTLAQARELAMLARERGRLLSVFHNRRWDGDFLTVRALLASGELGRITQFESHFDRFRPQVRQRWREDATRGGGLLYDLGPHLIDQAFALFGAPETVTAFVRTRRDNATALASASASARSRGAMESRQSAAFSDSSSTCGGRASNGTPAASSMALRVGLVEARISFMPGALRAVPGPGS